jgi:hypothetical protein
MAALPKSLTTEQNMNKFNDIQFKDSLIGMCMALQESCLPDKILSPCTSFPFLVSSPAFCATNIIELSKLRPTPSWAQLSAASLS